MAERQSHAWFWHPAHEWRGFGVDRAGLWPIVTLGWRTVEILPASIAGRVADVLATLRGKEHG